MRVWKKEAHGGFGRHLGNMYSFIQSCPLATWLAELTEGVMGAYALIRVVERWSPTVPLLADTPLCWLTLPSVG